MTHRELEARAVLLRHLEVRLQDRQIPRQLTAMDEACGGVFSFPGPPVAIRPYRPSDRPTVFRLLSVLPSLYPCGASWLDRRLDDVLWGKARCTVAVINSAPVGITIETPKEPRKLKLSTIYVRPSFRGLGIGTRLLRQCRKNWVNGDIGQVSVTADVRRAGSLLPLFMNFGFMPIAIERGRYGPDRDEMVFVWLLDAQ